MHSLRHALLPAAALTLTGGLLFGITGCAPTPTSAPPRPSAMSSIITVGSTTDDGTIILATTSVGDNTFVLGQNGSAIRFGASFHGTDPNQNWETFGDPVAVAADDLTVVNPGNFPDAAPGGLATVTGQLGSDVTALDIVTHAGDTVEASVSSGYYVAAWEGRDFDDRDTLDATFVLHLVDGSTSTVSYADATEE
ncbi:hypothetical protein N1027_14395 [Herbiconiux sp. CPCC 205763]|uniref:Uncharacterized protein n=1 Tax=Herbiconiux aconitum TaxID=2970913 RepID=A0ABT2GSY4_9MICO|nr:hypothetical protein [Herbiconiux aconitum]MCS5719324.1 hypothetical protein [Herbiconiux aconitum]